jgi:glycosyltransferase involved in cell wall biosynthesis
MASPKVLIIIPAYNEAKNLVKLIPEIRENTPDYSLIVINDGSTDNTTDIITKLGCNSIRLPINSGIGVTVQTGFLFALEKGFDVAVQVDGDGQHKPSEVPKLVKAVLCDECDVAIGSRFITKTSYHSTLARRLGIIILSTLIRILTGKLITDPTSGLRVFNRRALEYLAEDYAEDYPEVESNLLLLVQGFRVKEFPVEMRSRKYGRSSIDSIKALYYMLKVSLCLILVRLRGTKK